MSGKKTAVFGIYSSLPTADSATDTLVRSGFPAADISALLPDNLGGKEIGTQKATKAPEGAATGAGSGAVLGGALGLLAGIGALAIPGVGPFIAAGPIMAALSGAALGATTGGLVGGLIGLGIPEIETKRYEEKLRNGNFLIAVDARDSDHVDRAKEIFKDAGAEDIATSSLSKAPRSTASTRGSETRVTERSAL